MLHPRFLVPLLPISVLVGALSLLSAACGGSSSSGSGGSTPANDCYDYTKFTGTTPAVSFKADVVPILRRSCAISIACHGSDPNAPGSTTSGYKPYLGTSMSDASPTAQQLLAMISTSVGQPAALQTSTLDGSMVGNPDMDIVKAGDPSKSFLMYKLDGSFPGTADNTEVTCSTLSCTTGKNCGLAMPSGGPSLPSSDRDTIRRWIAQGAQNN